MTPLPRNNSQRIPSKQGWRTIGGKTAYFRSKQEANYARFLDLMKRCGKLVDWFHEPDIFWFDGIKRGINNYTPDFKVIYETGIEYHEVKGWMDSRSKTKIKRMAKYHPNVILKVFDIKWYRANEKKLKSLIPDWE